MSTNISRYLNITSKDRKIYVQIDEESFKLLEKELQNPDETFLVWVSEMTVHIPSNLTVTLHVEPK